MQISPLKKKQCLVGDFVIHKLKSPRCVLLWRRFLYCFKFGFLLSIIDKSKNNNKLYICGMRDSLLKKFLQSWAEEFDTADLEQKKMIACQLFDRIELGKDYNIIMHMNVTYQQFCSEWKSKNSSQVTA